MIEVGGDRLATSRPISLVLCVLQSRLHPLTAYSSRFSIIYDCILVLFHHWLFLFSIRSGSYTLVFVSLLYFLSGCQWTLVFRVFVILMWCLDFFRLDFTPRRSNTRLRISPLMFTRLSHKGGWIDGIICCLRDYLGLGKLWQVPICLSSCSMSTCWHIIINVRLYWQFHQIDNRHLALLMLDYCISDLVLRIRWLQRIDVLVMSQKASVLLLTHPTNTGGMTLARYSTTTNSGGANEQVLLHIELIYIVVVSKLTSAGGLLIALIH